MSESWIVLEVGRETFEGYRSDFPQCVGWPAFCCRREDGEFDLWPNPVKPIVLAPQTKPGRYDARYREDAA